MQENDYHMDNKCETGIFIPTLGQGRSKDWNYAHNAISDAYFTVLQGSVSTETGEKCNIFQLVKAVVQEMQQHRNINCPQITTTGKFGHNLVVASEQILSVFQRLDKETITQHKWNLYAELSMIMRGKHSTHHERGKKVLKEFL